MPVSGSATAATSTSTLGSSLLVSWEGASNRENEIAMQVLRNCSYLVRRCFWSKISSLKSRTYRRCGVPSALSKRRRGLCVINVD